MRSILWSMNDYDTDSVNRCKYEKQLNHWSKILWLQTKTIVNAGGDSGEK